MASTNYVTKINKQPIAASQVAPNSPLESKLSNMEATIAELEGVGAFAVVPLTGEGEQAIPDPESAVPPVELSTKIIYLTKDAQSTEKDPYTEWIYIEGDPSGSWQIIGTTSINLTNYVQKVDGGTMGNFASLTEDGAISDSGKAASDFATAAQGAKADTAVQEVTVNGGANLKSGTSVKIPLATTSTDGAMSAADKGKLEGIESGAQVNVKSDWDAQAGAASEILHKPDLSVYATTQAMETALSGKQDTISDLATIRSGAASGATAYQLPSDGIPSANLASAVQVSLGKADTAYQKPNGGIPASDINLDSLITVESIDDGSSEGSNNE